MKKLIVVAIIMAMLAIMAFPLFSSAASVLYITITATGSEVSITCNQTAWNVGTVQASTTATTAINWARLTNAGSEAVDVTIAGRSMKNAGGTNTWTLANDASPGSAIFGMEAGLDDAGDLYDITIKNVGETLNKLVDELAPGNQDFGLKFYAPTSTLGNDVMEMVGAGGTAGDSPRGLVLTGSID